MAGSRPDGLGERGSALWDELTTGRVWDASGLVLLAEACRLADRLEQLDRLLRGDVDAWARIQVVNGGELVIQVDAAMSEARLTAGALRQLLAQLRLGEVKAPTAPPTQPKGSRLDELSRARARRGATTSDPGSSSRS